MALRMLGCLSSSDGRALRVGEARAGLLDEMRGASMHNHGEDYFRRELFHAIVEYVTTRSGDE